MEQLTQVLDSYLRPHVYGLSSFVKDNIDFLSISKNLHFPIDTWLGTIDVETLYSSIPHDKGIFAVGQFMKMREKQQWPLNEFMLNALDITLHNIVFTFNEKIYLQTGGGDALLYMPTSTSVGGNSNSWRMMTFDVPVPQVH